MKNILQIFNFLKRSCTIPKWILIFIFYFSLIDITNGQDVAICGFNSDDPDGIALVALVDVPSTQNVFVTDDPWDTATNTFDETTSPSVNEGTVQVTWSGTWMKGTIIRVVETGTSVFTVDASTNGPSSPAVSIVYAGDGFSLTGTDGLSVFTSNNVSDPNSNVVEVYSFINPHESSSLDKNPNLDMDCPCSNDFVELDFNDTNVDGGNFNPGLRSAAVSLTEFNTAANWSTGNTNVGLDLTEFANLTFGGSGVLPIELISFYAKINNEFIDLYWDTASELNNDRFEIETSTDGIKFQIIGQVRGEGNSVELQYYSFEVRNPQSGISYYRLKQIDFDGQFEYSKVISANFRENSGDIGEFYPNPSKSGLVNLDYFAHNDDEISISFFDMTEKLVFNHTQSISIGNNNFSFDFSELNSGIYIVRIGDERNLTRRKLIIER